MNYDVFFLANPKIPLIKQKIYKNCKIIYEKPLEHIRGSDLVVFTDSSVIEYAITYKKKILNLFSKEIKSYPINYKASKTFYKFFKHQPLNLDKLKSENQILDKIMYPNRKYQLYEEMFIKSANTKKITYASLIKNLLKK